MEPVRQCDLSSSSPKDESVVKHGRLIRVTLLVMLLHMTPFHSQQSSLVDHEERTPDGSLIPCLKFKRACMSC